VDAPGAVVVEAEGAGVVVVSGAFGVVGTEVVVVGVCDVVGAVVVEFGDCANAAVAKTIPTAVLMRKRVFISGFSCWVCMERVEGLVVPIRNKWQSLKEATAGTGSGRLNAVPTTGSKYSGNIRQSDVLARIPIGGVEL